MPDPLQNFYSRVHQIAHLLEAQQNLEWDQEVMMPSKGAPQRVQHLSALATVIHEKSTAPELGELISLLETDCTLDELTRADVREARRAFDRSVMIPARLVAERTEACALAQGAWQDARPKSDFAAFRPHLERVVALTREMADAIGTDNRYDALLDEYEPGMTEAQLKVVFADLKARLLPLLDAVLGVSRKPDAIILSRNFPIQGQEALCRRVIQDMGFDLDAGRFDVSVHPFTNGTFRDVRLTTRYLENFLPCALFGAIHEAGHGLYEQGLDSARFSNPAGKSASMGIHESQSRLWENLIGRSRPFWIHYDQPLRDTFPGVLDGVSSDAFYGAVNTVSPSLIRVEADEATYNLHILLRFDIESDLLAGRVEARDLPALWNAKMKEYLGIEPPTDRDGVLQDIHWSAGLIGYFPTYALGNLYAAQFLEAMRRDLPDLDEHIAKGELHIVKDWLNERIHIHGRRWLAQELCTQVTGGPLTAEPLMRHLKEKYAAIYGI